MKHSQLIAKNAKSRGEQLLLAPQGQVVGKIWLGPAIGSRHSVRRYPSRPMISLVKLRLTGMPQAWQCVTSPQPWMGQVWSPEPWSCPFYGPKSPIAASVWHV